MLIIGIWKRGHGMVIINMEEDGGDDDVDGDGDDGASRTEGDDDDGSWTMLLTTMMVHG